MTVITRRSRHADPQAEVDFVRAELLRLAALPLERAETLPPEAYFSPAVYDLEIDNIFRRDWLCVGRVDQMPNPGDYITADIVGEPVVVTRDEDGSLHALSRVCRHRFMDILDPGLCPATGNLKRLTCPYHTWTYKLDGQYVGMLSAAPEMREVEFDKASCRLPRYGIEVWKGFIFVNLDPDAAALTPQLRDLDDMLGAFDFTDWKTVHTLDWGEVAANWKIAIENGAEAYHHLGTHKDSLQALWPAQFTRPDDTDGLFFSAHMPVSDAFATGEVDGHKLHPTFLPTVPGLRPDQLSETLIVGIFPLFFFALSPDFVSWFEWWPTGPGSHTTKIHMVVPPDSIDAPGADQIVEQVMDYVRQIQHEDAATIMGVQRGLTSRTSYSGRLSHLERPIWQFERYLADRLA
jgi:phenylpropionate dioxygenase-like ring-hydroxylating dioxygenase large terminal subunit